MASRIAGASSRLIRSLRAPVFPSCSVRRLSVASRVLGRKASPSSSSVPPPESLSPEEALSRPILFVDPLLTASLSSTLSAYPATRVSTLSNGLRVATETQPSTEIATVGLWINAGSRYETEKNNGVAHFLEHMTFKGTSRRSRVSLEMEVENLGGHLNAYTSREQTVFFAKVLKQDVNKAVDILSDILQNSVVAEPDVERERDTILREMKEIDGNMEEVVYDKLHATAYRGTALARTILGPAENIESITREQIQQYVRTHYTADRIVLAAAGAVDHDALVRLSERAFASLPSQSPKGEEPYMEPARFTGSDILTRYDDMPLAHVAYAYQTAGWEDADSIPLMLIALMLGSWEKTIHAGIHSSSKLVSESAKWQLADSISTFNTNYSDTGLFGIYAVAEPTCLSNLTHLMVDCMTRLAYDVDDVLVSEAKNQLKFNTLSHLSGTERTCEEIGRHMLTYGRRIHPAEMLARIDAVDARAVKQAAKRFFFDRDHALAAIGPIYELPDYNWRRTRSYLARY